MGAKKPERLCVTCRQMKPKEALLRVVAFEGQVLPDPTGKAPGRGAYVCRTGTCFQAALREGRLQRSLRVALTPEAEEKLLRCWEEMNGADLRNRSLNLIGLGRRGKRLALGSQAAELALRRGQARLLLLAEDGSGQTKEPLKRLAQGNAVPCYELGTAEELGQLTGKAQRVAVAVTDEDLAQGLMPLLEALETLRQEEK